MKFIVNSQILCKQLQSISGIITNSNTVPIINHFHFHLDGNSLTLKSTNLATTLCITIAVDSADTNDLQDIAIPSGLLLNILKSLDDAPAIFDIDASNFSVTISSGEGQYRLAGRNAESFPTLPEMEDVTHTTIAASLLVKAITMTTFATSPDEESHQQLSGVFCEIGTDYTTFVGTDGHKLVRYRRMDIKADEPASFILPSKPINIIKNILASNKEDVEVSMDFNRTNVSFSWGNTYAVCRLIDGRYPNYEAAIPSNNPFHMIIDRSTLLNTLRRVSLFANKSTNQVRFVIGSDNIVISTEDIEFANDAKEKIPCSYEGDELEIGFNAKFLIDMLNNTDAEQLQIDLASPLKPGLLSPITNENDDNNENVLMLIMPVSLSY